MTRVKNKRVLRGPESVRETCGRSLSGRPRRAVVAVREPVAGLLEQQGPFTVLQCLGLALFVPATDPGRVRIPCSSRWSGNRRCRWSTSTRFRFSRPWRPRCDPCRRSRRFSTVRGLRALSVSPNVGTSMPRGERPWLCAPSWAGSTWAPVVDDFASREYRCIRHPRCCSPVPRYRLLYQTLPTIP